MSNYMHHPIPIPSAERAAEYDAETLDESWRKHLAHESEDPEVLLIS